MNQDKKYILDTTKAIEKWNNSNQNKRHKNQSSLAREIGISKQSLAYWKKGGEKTPKWISRALKITQIVPSKLADIITTVDGVCFVDYEKIKNDYNNKYFDRTQITIRHILKFSGSSRYNSKSANWVKILLDICTILECEPSDIIFEI